MDMKLMIWLTIIGGSFADNASSLITYTRYGTSITAYPHDIPLDAESIIIDSTRINHVDYIEVFPNLISYKLVDNQVSEFPDLSNVSNTIIQLIIQKTEIDTLPVDVMATMPRLQYLDISYNRITHIPDIITVFPKLMTLRAHDNDIVWMGQSTAHTIYMENNHMRDLPDLSYRSDEFLYLDLTKNNITSLSSDPIPFLPNCSYLDLSSNKLTTFPNFTLLPSLTSVRLASNQIIHLPDGPLPLPPTCQTLDLSKNLLYTFPILGNVTTLVTITLYDNNILTIPNDAIPLLPHVTNLDLRYNKLQTFPDLSNLTGLTEVNLYSNEIRSFPEGPIPLPPRCIKLNLIKNKLTTFPDLTGAPDLESITLASNLIVSVPVGNIPLMPNCYELELTDNKLVAFPDMKNATKVTIVNLSHNQISSLPDGPIPLPANCSRLDLSYNQLTSFPTLDDASLLISIRIVSNQISVIPDGAIPPLPNCKEVYLMQNQLTTFPDLRNLTGLTTLDLSQNQINSIPEFVELPSLKTLILSDNKLPSLRNLMRISNSLESISVQNNDYSSLPGEFIVEIANLRQLEVGRYGLALYLPNFCLMNNTHPRLTLNIAYGSIYCDENVFYAKLAQNTGLISFKIVPTCRSPSHLLGRQFDKLIADDIWLGQSGEIQGSYTKLIAPWSCPVSVEDPFSVLSKVKCAITCKEQQNCPLFSYENNICVITNMDGHTDMTAFEQHTDWYLMSG